MEPDSSAHNAPEFPRERLSILNDRQFTSSDVCAVVGINAKQLEHAIDPKRCILTLSTHDETRVRGKRRLFTGSDCLKINTLFVTNAIGFPQRFANTLAGQVARRAANRLCGLDTTPHLAVATWPMKNGDWAQQAMYQGAPDLPLPLAFHIIAVDELIDQTLRKLEAVIADESIPSFEIPDPQPEPNPYSPQNDSLLAWAKEWCETSEPLSRADRHSSLRTFAVPYSGGNLPFFST